MPVAAQEVYVVVNGVILGTPACKLRDWSDLATWAPIRGENVLIPGMEGRVNVAKFDDERDVMLGLQVNGFLDEDGVGNANPAAAALDYLVELETRLGKGLESVEFQWFRYDLTTLSGDVQVEGISRPQFRTPSVADFTLDLILPPTLEEL